jgi:multidrug/hemolysin transport system ATP-binding protein
MEEAADADYIVILDSGRIAAEGTPLELKNRFTGDYILLYTDEESVKKIGKPYTKVGDGFRVAVRDTAEATDLILKYPEIFTDYEIIKGKMDDVFLNATGKNLGGENV